MKKLLLFALLCLPVGLRAQQTGVILGAAATTTCSAPSNAIAVVAIAGNQGGATFTVTANASANTISFFASGDGQTTWVALNVTPSNSTSAVTTTTGTGTFQANVAGYTHVCMEISTLVSGTATVSIRPSTASARTSGGGSGQTIAFNAAQTIYVAAPGLTTCDYAGTVVSCTPSTTAATCGTQAAPCQDYSTLAAKYALTPVLLAGATAQLSRTAGSASPSGKCYQPNSVVFDGVSQGVGDNTVIKTLYGGTESYPVGLLTIVGDSTTPANVKQIGASTCAGTTPATTFGVIFRGLNVRITGIECDYFAGTSPVNGGCFVAEGGNSTLYIDNENSTSNSHGYVAIALDAAHLKFGPNETWAQVNGWSVNSGGTWDTHTPAGDMTVTYTNSGTGNFVDSDESGTHGIIDSTGSLSMTFNGTGAYNIFLLNNSTIGWFGNAAMTFNFNCTACTEIAINPGEVGTVSSMFESCGTTNVTCAFAAGFQSTSKRVNVAGYGFVGTGPTTAGSADMTNSTVTKGCWYNANNKGRLRCQDAGIETNWSSSAGVALTGLNIIAQGVLNSTLGNGGSNMTLTNFEISIGTPAAGCTTSPVVAFEDKSTSTVLSSLTIANAAAVAGNFNLSVAMTAGDNFEFIVTTAGSGCTTAPSNLNYTVSYVQ